MKRMRFSISIDAPVAAVYRKMIGKETFRQWAAVFNPTSDFEGGGVGGRWESGAKILFVGTDEQGKKGGMVGYIRENAPNRFVSIEYVGVLDGDNEITEGSLADEWRGFENYTFESCDGLTMVTADVDVNDQMIEYFEKTYPRALEKLKELCELDKE